MPCRPSAQQTTITLYAPPARRQSTTRKGGDLQTEDSVTATLVIIVGVIVGVVAYNVGAWRERQKIPEYRASIISRKACDARVEEVSDDLLGAISGDSMVREVIRLRTLPIDKVSNDVLTFCSEISSFSDDDNQFDYWRR